MKNFYPLNSVTGDLYSILAIVQCFSLFFSPVYYFYAMSTFPFSLDESIVN